MGRRGFGASGGRELKWIVENMEREFRDFWGAMVKRELGI